MPRNRKIELTHEEACLLEALVESESEGLHKADRVDDEQESEFANEYKLIASSWSKLTGRNFYTGKKIKRQPAASSRRCAK